jgi:hypothetical protein
MNTFTARQIVLVARPNGKPKLTDFRLRGKSVPTPIFDPHRTAYGDLGGASPKRLFNEETEN